MAILLVILAFILVMVGVWVQVSQGSYEVRFSVLWLTGIAALVLVVFAARIYT